MNERKNLDFTAIDLKKDFCPRDGGVSGITEKVLSGDLDTERRRGSRTRLIRLAPGTQTPAAHAHDYWEEIYVLEGAMIVADAAAEDGERIVAAPAHACREPGFMHGPVRSEGGCLLLEFSWYDKD